ncbi:MAG: EamA family transporter RarD [Oceanicaulis sp.]
MSERPAPAPATPATPAGAGTERLDPARAGAALITGYLIWGLSPLFYKLLAFASPTEIVLHRAVWSVPLLALLLVTAKRWTPALQVLSDRRKLALLLVTALLIGANWWTFIFAVNSGQVLEISLGYYINPLVNVALGVFVASERFGALRKVAVGLAALGVVNQVVTVGELPVIALFLAASFTGYGYLRKTMQVDGRIGLFWETVIIALPSIAVLGFVEFGGGGGHFRDGWSQALLLILSGAMTVAPLLFFLIGARGSSFAVIGAAQFIAPTLQFCVGLIYGETFTPAHALTFALIWLGLAVFVADLLLYERKKRTKARP